MLSAAKAQIDGIKGQAQGATGGGGALGALSGAKGIGAIGKLMPAITAGVAGIAAITAGIALVVKALMDYKPLMNMVNMIVKILTMILRPIADVIIILLMPILYILKPILMVANQLIAPYRRLAFQLLAAGGQALQEGDTGAAALAFAGAAQTMMAGLQTFIVGLFSAVIKMSLSGIAELLKAVTGGLIRGIGFLLSFIPGVGDAIQEGANKAADFIESGIDFVVKAAHAAVDIAGTVLILANATMIAGMTKALGVVTDEQLAQFVTGVSSSLKTVFASDTSGMIVDKWTDVMLGALDLMDTNVVKKIKEMEDNWNTAMAVGTKAGAEEGVEEAGLEVEKGQLSFWQKTKNLFVSQIGSLIDPIGSAIDLFRFGIKENFEHAISGENGLLSVTTKEFLGFERHQDDMVKPIADLRSRFQKEVDAFNSIQVRNASVSGYRSSRSR